MESSPWSRRKPPTPPSTLPSSPPGNGKPQIPVAPLRIPERPSNASDLSRLPTSPAHRVQGTSSSEEVRKKASGRKIVASKKKLAIAGVVLSGFALATGFAVFGRSATDNETANESTVISGEQPTGAVTVPPVIAQLPEGATNWDDLARSVVFIRAASPCDWRGSGTLVLDGSYVLTNEHVSSDGRCKLTVGLTESLSSEPVGNLDAIVVARDVENDLAVLRLVDSSGNPVVPSGHKPVTISFQQPPLGAKLTTLGYPALGTYDAGMTITFTSGDFSGIDTTFGEFFKTTAQMRGGVSGGAAFTDDGRFIGVPTGGFLDEETGEDIGINLIRPAKFAEPLLAEAQRVDPSTTNRVPDQSGSDFESTSTDPRFRTCKEAMANGYGPYYFGIDDEYDWYIDADSDGIVCE
jgi:S1-C subfamily serine protease